MTRQYICVLKCIHFVCIKFEDERIFIAVNLYTNYLNNESINDKSLTCFYPVN